MGLNSGKFKLVVVEAELGFKDNSFSEQMSSSYLQVHEILNRVLLKDRDQDRPTSHQLLETELR